MAVQIDLTGKKALVFGIANENSIAWHIAKRLNDAGCRIAAAYQERVEPWVLPLTNHLDSPFYDKCDVVDDAQLNGFFTKLKEGFGNFDFLIHSIAFAKRGNLRGRLIDTEKKDFNIAVEVSAFSLIKIIKKFEGIINNNGSIVALTYIGSQKVVPNYNVMGAAKAALEATIKYAAFDLGEKNIRVNGISAGPIPTLAASGISGFMEILANHASKSPLKRNITAEEVADVALFLCSDLSSGITGEIIFVDAGYHIMGV